MWIWGQHSGQSVDTCEVTHTALLVLIFWENLMRSSDRTALPQEMFTSFCLMTFRIGWGCPTNREAVQITIPTNPIHCFVALIQYSKYLLLYHLILRKVCHHSKSSNDWIIIKKFLQCFSIKTTRADLVRELDDVLRQDNLTSSVKSNILVINVTIKLLHREIWRFIFSLYVKKRYSCNQCYYQATQKVNLKTHIQSVHKKIKYQSINWTD